MISFQNMVAVKMRQLAGWLRQMMGGSGRAVAAERAKTAVPDTQLAVLSGIVHADADRGDRAWECHQHAEVHVNAALYELDRLREELAGVLGSKAGAVQSAQAASPAATGVADSSQTVVERPVRGKVGIAA